MRDTTFQSTLGPAQPRPRVGATRRTYVRACAKKNSIAARARAATGSPLPALGRGSSWGRRRLNARASRAASTSARLPRTFSFLRVVRFGAFAPTAARRGRARALSYLFRRLLWRVWCGWVGVLAATRARAAERRKEVLEGRP